MGELVARLLLSSGFAPPQHRKADENSESTIPTFGAFADECINSHERKIRNEEHVAQWEMTLGDPYCGAICAKPTNEIDTDAAISVLHPN
jgi:hypothetical protein